MLSWGPLALIPVAGEALPMLMACVLVSNLGAAITEVAQDALVAEYGQKHKMIGLQSYTFIAIAIAGIIGNSLGGIILSKMHPRIVLMMFTTLLLIQLCISLATKEECLGLSKPSSQLVGQEPVLGNIDTNKLNVDPIEAGSKEVNILGSIKRQFSVLIMALREETISWPLTWLVASTTMVPMLTGSIFCYQTQYLNLDPAIIGMSKVIGQVVLLLLTVMYNRRWKNIPMRKLIATVQTLYAASLLLDLVLVQQINLKIGIPNDIFALCFSSLAETIHTFKCIPFFVLIGSVCPAGCEASVTAFLASALTLSSIFSGFFGIGLASLLGITSDNYANLPVGVIVQSLTALIPLLWINNLPISQPGVEKESNKERSKGTIRDGRVGRFVFNTIFSYRQEREYEAEK